MSLPESARKRPEELVARYRLEPSIREVFVEGKYDKNILTRFLRSVDLPDVAVYEISVVDIAAERVIASGHPDSARGRVVFLAFFMESELEPASRAITCVADRDYDSILKRGHRCPFLLFFDHSSVEMYAFDAEILDLLIKDLVPSLQKTGRQVLQELEGLLKNLFAIRATNISLGLGLTWLSSMQDSCEISADTIQFDESDFVSRYLGKNGQLRRKEQFVQILQEMKARMDGDPRHFIRGHDFVHCLSWYLRSSASKSLQMLRPDNLQVLLLAYLEPSRLAATAFFHELVDRVNHRRSAIA